MVQRVGTGRAATTWVVGLLVGLLGQPTTARRPDHPAAVALAAVMLDRFDDCMTKSMRTWLRSMRDTPPVGVRPVVDPPVVLPEAMAALVLITVVRPVVVPRVVRPAVTRRSCEVARRVVEARVGTAMAAPTAADTHR